MDIDNVWSPRISLANKQFIDWAEKFKCKHLWKYFEGEQWQNREGYNPYTFNQVYSTISIKIASFLFGNPKFEVTSTPTASEYDLEAAGKAAQIKEDFLNALVRNRHSKFKEELELTFQDSWFFFGLMEVGYAADWIINPRADKPEKKSDTVVNISPENDRIVHEPRELPANERIYFKRIKPNRFRVGGQESTYLEEFHWCGYYDFYNRADLLTMKGLKNKDKITGSITYPSSNLASSEDNAIYLENEDHVKVWHIWDSRQRRRLLLLDGNFEVLFSSAFERLPLFDLRWIYREKGFYPIPPVFHWLSPQDELNESREQLRSHRRRFTRKYQIVEQMIDDDELAKFESGGDGTLVKVKRENAITPILDSNLGQANDQSFIIAKDEFNILAGTSAEMRGYADRTTATQAKLIDQRSSVREDYESARVKTWITALGREALLLGRDKISLGTWVKVTAPPGEFLGQFQPEKQVYQFVTSEDLTDGFDFNITLDILSISPAAQEIEKRKFMEFLTICNQFPQIGLSPYLVREAAYRVGYRNEQAIQQFQHMAMLQMMGAYQAASQNSMAQGMTAQNTPNTGTQIQNQLQNQVPGS
jgi:hypothetical protein